MFFPARQDMISTIPLFDKTKASTTMKFIGSKYNCSFQTCFLLHNNCFCFNVVLLKIINHTTIGHYCIGRKLVYETFQYILWAVFCFLRQTKTSTRMKFIRSEDNCSFQTSFYSINIGFILMSFLLKTINYTIIGVVALAICWCRNFSIHHKSCFFPARQDMISTIPLFDKTKASTRMKFICSEYNCSFQTCFYCLKIVFILMWYHSKLSITQL